jgi:hypothetical protein
MTSRQLTVLVLLMLFDLTAIELTNYHAYNFSDYMHRKGDEKVS